MAVELISASGHRCVLWDNDCLVCRERAKRELALAFLVEEARKVIKNHEEGFSCQDGVAQGLREALEGLGFTV